MCGMWTSISSITIENWDRVGLSAPFGLGILPFLGSVFQLSLHIVYCADYLFLLSL